MRELWSGLVSERSHDLICRRDNPWRNFHSGYIIIVVKWVLLSRSSWLRGCPGCLFQHNWGLVGPPLPFYRVIIFERTTVVMWGFPGHRMSKILVSWMFHGFGVSETIYSVLDVNVRRCSATNVPSNKEHQTSFSAKAWMWPMPTTILDEPINKLRHTSNDACAITGEHSGHENCLSQCGLCEGPI